MTAKPFVGPKLKITRAEKHISDFGDSLSAYLARDPFAVFVQENPDTGRERLVMTGREEVPDNLLGIFGDAVHNLRAALDILANDLVALSGALPNKVYFPFGKGPDHFETQLQEKMAGAKADILDVIRGFKPYPAIHGGDEFLRSLHDLDIQDKHVCVITPHMRTTIHAPLIPTEKPDPKAIAAFVTDFSQLKTVKADLTGFNFTAPGKIIGKVADCAPDLVIAPGLPLEGYPVVAALDGMSDAAKRVVETCEAYCTGGE